MRKLKSQVAKVSTVRVEKIFEKSKVTCVAWLPGNNSQFLVAYASGSMYVYCIDSQTSNLPPVYQVFKQVQTIYSVL